MERTRTTKTIAWVTPLYKSNRTNSGAHESVLLELPYDLPNLSSLLNRVIELEIENYTLFNEEDSLRAIRDYSCPCCKQEPLIGIVLSIQEWDRIQRTMNLLTVYERSKLEILIHEVSIPDMI